jgi:hypothetical protein
MHSSTIGGGAILALLRLATKRSDQSRTTRRFGQMLELKASTLEAFLKTGGLIRSEDHNGQHLTGFELMEDIEDPPELGGIEFGIDDQGSRYTLLALHFQSHLQRQCVLHQN